MFDIKKSKSALKNFMLELSESMIMKESQTNSLTKVFFEILITASILWGYTALIELISFLYSTDFSFCFFLLYSLLLLISH